MLTTDESVPVFIFCFFIRRNSTPCRKELAFWYVQRTKKSKKELKKVTFLQQNFCANATDLDAISSFLLCFQPFSEVLPVSTLKLKSSEFFSAFLSELSFFQLSTSMPGSPLRLTFLKDSASAPDPSYMLSPYAKNLRWVVTFRNQVCMVPNEVTFERVIFFELKIRVSNENIRRRNVDFLHQKRPPQ